MSALHAAAPVRVDFAGGWTDVPPFSSTEGGVVVNAAIGLLAHARFEPGPAPGRLVSEDLEAEEELDPSRLEPTGPLALLRAAVRMLPPPGPGTLRTRCDAPPGSGLGTSGALDVALAAVLAAARGEPAEPLQLADRAWRLEAVEAGIAGGKQDQYAAALGGFHLLRFDDPVVTAEPLELDPAFMEALAEHAVLCYTGRSRLSGTTITRVIQSYAAGQPAVVGAFRAMRDAALAMAEALRAADLAATGRLLSENWRWQRALDPGMETEETARLEFAMRDAAPLGGKATGSGAGGCMFFLVNRRARAEEAARRAGATLLPVAWSREGVRLC